MSKTPPAFFVCGIFIFFKWTVLGQRKMPLESRRGWLKEVSSSLLYLVNAVLICRCGVFFPFFFSFAWVSPKCKAECLNNCPWLQAVVNFVCSPWILLTRLTRGNFHQSCGVASFRRRCPYSPWWSHYHQPLPYPSELTVWMLALILDKIYQCHVPLCSCPDLPTHPSGLKNSSNANCQ